MTQTREAVAQQRAAELELANQALRKGIAGLGQLDDLSHFLGEMLKAAVTAAGAQTGGVSLIDEQTQTFCVCPLLRFHGQIEPHDSALSAALPMTPGIRSIFNDISLTKETWIIPGNDPRLGEPYLQLHAAEGNRFLAHVPLRVGDRLLGALGLGFRAREPKFEKEMSLLRSLADQMSLAVEMVRLSQEAKSAAVARERELAAQQRAEELERANAALQETTDELAVANGLEQIVPTVLPIVARVFGAEKCGYYEFEPDGLIRQKFWLTEDVVYTPKEMARFEQDLVLQELSSGFVVPEGYVTGSPFSRIVPDVIDHYAGTNRPDFDKWAIEHGGGMELNVPLVVNGTPIGAVTLMRRGTRYTSEEIELAIALTRQLTLAVQASRLSLESQALAVENAVSREREQAVQARAIDLAQANEQLALRDRLLTASANALEQLISAADFSSGVADALRQIGEAAELSRVQVLMETALPNGELVHELIHEWWAAGLRSQKALGYLVFPNADNQAVIDLLHKGERWWARTEDWPSQVQPTFRELGIVWTGVVPIFVQQRYAGLVAFDQCVTGRDWSEAEIDALTIAARGIGAALSQERMAAQLENEREQAAQDRASELVKANFALRSSVDDLVTQTTTDGILTSLLKQAIDISSANSGAILRRIAGSEFEYVTIYANGSIRNSQEILAAGTNTEMRLASRLDPTGHFRGLANGDAQWREIENDALAAQLPRSTAFHKTAGNRRMYDFPYKVAGQVVGYLGLAFADHEPPSETVQETIKALATQVGLALEFRRISEQVERAAVTEERNKFARDLHDTLAQGYAAILMQLGAAEQTGQMPAVLQPFLTRIDDLARSNLTEARRTVSELRTSERVRDAFLVRISELARQLESVYGKIVQLSVTGCQRVLPPVIEDELYLIAQESLTNAMKHAQAIEVRLEVSFIERGLRLRVKDNGIGFASNERGKPDHFGLWTMQERAQRIHANLTIISEPGFGTEILTLWTDTPLDKTSLERR